MIVPLVSIRECLVLERKLWKLKTSQTILSIGLAWKLFHSEAIPNHIKHECSIKQDWKLIMDLFSIITFNKLPTKNGTIKIHVFNFINLHEKLFKKNNNYFYTYTLPKTSSILLRHLSHQWLLLKNRINIKFTL